MRKLKEVIMYSICAATLITAFLTAGHIDYETAKAEEDWQEANGGYEEISTIQWKQETETDPIPADLEQVEYETDCYVVKICTAYDWGQTIVTPDGNEFGVIDPPEFNEGQLISVLFDTKGTPSLKDDEIIDLWEFE